MFSSNQILQISGDLGEENSLYDALNFALKVKGIDFCDKSENVYQKKCVYQITPDNKYCIGWAPGSKVKEGWIEFPFDFDSRIVSQIIIQHLRKHEAKTGIPYGEYTQGFIMKVIPEYYGKEFQGILNPFYGIVEFKPYTCFYSK